MNIAFFNRTKHLRQKVHFSIAKLVYRRVHTLPLFDSNSEKSILKIPSKILLKESLEHIMKYYHEAWKICSKKNIQHHPHFCWSILFSDSFNLWPAYQLANHNDIAQAARITRIAYAMTLLKVQSWTGRIPWFEFTKYAANNKKNGRIWEVLLEIGGCVDILKFYLETWFHICFVFYVWINMYIYRFYIFCVCIAYNVWMYAGDIC